MRISNNNYTKFFIPKTLENDLMIFCPQYNYNRNCTGTSLQKTSKVGTLDIDTLLIRLLYLILVNILHTFNNKS